MDAGSKLDATTPQGDSGGGADGSEAGPASMDGGATQDGSDAQVSADSGCTSVNYPPGRVACSGGTPACPSTEPVLDASCPGAAAGLFCNYGNAALWNCRDYFICDCSGIWTRPLPLGCVNPSACTQVPFAGAPCDGGACTFPSNDGGYYCLQPPADSGCPAQMPNDGTCCQSPATCTYRVFAGGGTSTGTAQTMVCGDAGAWGYVMGPMMKGR